MSSNPEIQDLADREYEWGFVTDIEQDTVPPGLNEDVIRLISAKKEEPGWLLDWRMRAYQRWSQMREEDARWAKVDYEPIDYQAVSYYSAPKETPKRPREQQHSATATSTKTAHEQHLRVRCSSSLRFPFHL